MKKRKDSRPIYFLAREQEDGKFCIFNLDVFGVGGYVKTAALSQDQVNARTSFITKKWCLQCCDRHEMMRDETGNVPPMHAQHHDKDTNDERPKVGYGCEMRMGDGGPAYEEQVVNGTSVLIARAGDANRIHVNPRGIEPDAFEAIANERLPFRSVEILDPNVPDIGSIALMFSKPPFFALRPLVVILDKSRKEPAFKFQPAPLMASAQFASTSKRTFVSFTEIPVMKNKLLLVAKSLRQFCADEKELTTRMRLTFAADSMPPSDDDIKGASKEAMAAEVDEEEETEEQKKAKAVKLAAEQKGQGQTQSSDAQPSATEQKGQGQSQSSSKQETGKEEKGQGQTQSSAVKLAAEAPNPDPVHEKKETPAEEKKEHATGVEAKPGEGSPPANPGAQAAAPAPVAAPPAPPAAPVPPVAPMGQPATTQQAGNAIGEMMKQALEQVLEQAMAPLVNEVRGLLAGTPQGAPPVDQIAPVVSMAASRWAVNFSTHYSAALETVGKKRAEEVVKQAIAPVQMAAQPAALPQAPVQFTAQQLEELEQRFSAKFGAQLEEARQTIDAMKKRDAQQQRTAKFAAMVQEQVDLTGGMLRLDPVKLAAEAAEMPVVTDKVAGADGKVSDVTIDHGERYIRNVLENAGISAPPPAASFSAGSRNAEVPDELTPYKSNTKAFAAAQMAARDWDDNPKTQRMVRDKKKYISGEVYAATGFNADAGNNGKGRY